MKHGEIVFNEDGTVKDINGYDNGRSSFEFIELSEYYAIVDKCQRLVERINSHLECANNRNYQLKRLLKKLI